MAFTGKVQIGFDRHINQLLRTAKEGVLPIVQVGEPVLRQECIPFNGQCTEKTLAKLIDCMRSTMLAAPGVGLAGPQIGLNLAIAVVEDHIRFGADEFESQVDDELGEELEEDDDCDLEDDPREIAEFPFHEIINPSYEPIGEERKFFFEGCLSFHGYQAVRARWRSINAKWQDRHGVWHSEQLHGWPARIFQHETDHLHGEIYIDQAILRSLTNDDNLSDFWSEDPIPTSPAQELGFSLQ